jgi:hypothetical protein
MKNRIMLIGSALILAAIVPVATGCGGVHAQDVGAEAPPASKIVKDVDVTLFAVEHPEQLSRAQLLPTFRGKCRCRRLPLGESWKSTRAWAIR